MHMVNVETFVRGVRVFVPNRQIGTLADQIGVVRGIGERTMRRRSIVKIVSIEFNGQARRKRLRATSAKLLMGDDVARAFAVERNGVLTPVKEFRL